MTALQSIYGLLSNLPALSSDDDKTESRFARIARDERFQRASKQVPLFRTLRPAIKGGLFSHAASC